jgi:hypothetical protein
MLGTATTLIWLTIRKAVNLQPDRYERLNIDQLR